MLLNTRGKFHDLRLLPSFATTVPDHHSNHIIPRAYVVPRGGVASFQTPAEREAFGHEIQAWIRTKVAHHKYLRGGMFFALVVVVYERTLMYIYTHC